MSLFHLRLSEDVNDFLLVLLIVNCACLNVHLASLTVDRCSCLYGMPFASKILLAICKPLHQIYKTFCSINKTS